MNSALSRSKNKNTTKIRVQAVSDADELYDNDRKNLLIKSLRKFGILYEDKQLESLDKLEEDLQSKLSAIN